MKIKNASLISIVNTLQKYSNHKLPQKISYAIMRNLECLSKDSNAYTKSLNKIIDDFKNYYVIGEDGEPLIDNATLLPIIDEEHKEDFKKEINDLLDIDIEIPLYTIEQSSFDYDGEKYSPLSAAEIYELQNVLCFKDVKGE